MSNSAAASGIVLKNVTVPDEAAFRRLVSPYLGQPLTGGDLYKLHAMIVAYYRAHDRPFVDVLIPPQDISNGVLQIVVLEAHVGQVKVTGNQWFSTDQYRDAIRLQPGDPISASTLQADLDWIDQNPFRQATTVFSPGATTGLTDITIQAKDRFPLRVFAGVDNDGTALTGTHELYTGFTWGNVFGLGDLLNYQYTTSADGRSLRENSASYVMPLPWRDTFTVFGSYATTVGAIPPLTTESGEAWQLSTRYALRLIPLGTYHQQATFGFDFKHNQNALLFGTIPVSSTPADIDQFVLGYDGAAPDHFGQTSFNLRLFLSPGGMMGDNTDTAFSAVRPFSRAEYIYGNLWVERQINLPADFSLMTRAAGQFASTNLQPSEELGLGSYESLDSGAIYTNRGYDYREVNGDKGFDLTAELRTPAYHPAKLVGLPQVEDRLQLLAFMDYGGVFPEHPIPGSPNSNYLWSIGVGFHYDLSRFFSARFDYGFQLIHTGLDNDHGSRADFSLVASF